MIYDIISYENIVTSYIYVGIKFNHTENMYSINYYNIIIIIGYI